MSTRVQVATVITTAAVASALTVFTMVKMSAGDEDRPLIIVRSGSVKLDDGEAKNWKPWKEHGSKKQWQPDHSKGGSVASFSVTVANANGAAAPASPCPSLPLVGTKIAVEYTTDAGVKSQLTLSRASQGSKFVPQVDAPVELDSVPGSGDSPAQLVYDPGPGMISNVVVSDDAGGQQMCGFTKPAAAVVTIKSNR